MRIDDQWCQEALEIIKDVQDNVLVTSLNRQYSYDECRQFDVVASCTTGTDHIENRGIPLISLQGETDFLQDVPATAEHTFALILSLIRRIPWAFDDVKRGNWDREAWQGTELRGKTIGIIGGLGRVGSQVARIAEAFNMNVIAFDKIDYDSKMTVGDRFSWLTGNIDRVFEHSDIITVHVPLNAETKGMFGIEQFQQMKPTAYFVNTSRGAVINEFTLIAALLKKWIAGAAIDVTEHEPDIHPWLCQYAEENNNLIITPHIAGNTAESRKKTQCFIASKIANYIKESAK